MIAPAGEGKRAESMMQIYDDPTNESYVTEVIEMQWENCGSMGTAVLGVFDLIY